jgi:hypothetical protein
MKINWTAKELQKVWSIKKPSILKGKRWRRGWESNPRIKVLQTSPLPLGYRALELASIAKVAYGFSRERLFVVHKVIHRSKDAPTACAYFTPFGNMVMARFNRVLKRRLAKASCSSDVF